MRREKKTNSFLVGLLVIFVGISMVWNNEANILNTDTSLNEAQKEYIEVKNDKINYSNNDKLIVTSGTLDETTQTVTDPLFNIKITGNKLKRTVEIYQVDQECDTDSDGNEHCDIKYVWSEDLIESNFFSTTEKNPETKPYESETFYATDLKLGAYTIDQDLIKQLPAEEKIYDLNQASALENRLSIVENTYTTVDGEPRVGDIRITYTANKSTIVTAMGVQKENKLDAYIASNGYKVKAIKEGTYTGKELITKLKQENTSSGWTGRLLGFFIITFGFLFLFLFINKIVSWIPGVGRVVGLLSIGISFVAGFAITLFVIALAWLRYKPVVSLLLIVAGIVFILGIIKIKNIIKNKLDSKEQEQHNNTTILENNNTPSTINQHPQTNMMQQQNTM